MTTKLSFRLNSSLDHSQWGRIPLQSRASRPRDCCRLSTGSSSTPTRRLCPDHQISEVQVLDGIRDCTKEMCERQPFYVSTAWTSIETVAGPQMWDYLKQSRGHLIIIIMIIIITIIINIIIRTIMIIITAFNVIISTILITIIITAVNIISTILITIIITAVNIISTILVTAVNIILYIGRNRF